MNKITCLFLLLISISSTTLFSQNNIENYIKKGIEFHDKRQYDKAINTYEKALEIDPNSTHANYEISYSYFMKGDNKNTIKYADKVIDANAEFLIHAYINKGSALDLQGKTDESIKLFKKVKATTAGHYLIDYNLALNYYKAGKYDEAESNILDAISKNANHASSHLILADIESNKKHPAKALLSIYYFLFLEPDSKRSETALKILDKNLKGNVTKDGKNTQIQYIVTPGEENDFSAAELMISLNEAVNNVARKQGKTEEELFVVNTQSFFSTVGVANKQQEDIWWNLYIPFFSKLEKSNHLETFCTYITQSRNDQYEAWLSKNEDKLIQFGTWIKQLN